MSELKSLACKLLAEARPYHPSLRLLAHRVAAGRDDLTIHNFDAVPVDWWQDYLAARDSDSTVEECLESWRGMGFSSQGGTLRYPGDTKRLAKLEDQAVLRFAMDVAFGDEKRLAEYVMNYHNNVVNAHCEVMAEAGLI